MSSSGRRFHRPYVSMVASSGGPLLIQDTRLVEELSHFNRERIPERVVHAKGSGGFGKFFLTKPIPQWTRAKIFTEVKEGGVPVAVRFSTVGGEKGSADTVRDPRGFAIKFYTDEGNLDLVANNTPIFFINDPILFPSLVHSQKRNPQTNLRDPDAYWDFLSSIPQSLHQVCYLHSDRGIPDGYRHMHGFACHTYQFTPASLNKVGAINSPFYVKFHFKTQQGIKNLTSEQAEKLAGSDPDYSTRDLFDAIKRGDFPKWTLAIQVITEEQRLEMKENIFDITTTWSQKRFPLHEVGHFVLDENPTNHFTDIEQLAFCPSNLVPGIDPSPDRVFQGRIFAYADAQRYRLGVNFNDLRVNKPRCPLRDVTYRDGAGCVTDNHGSLPNYFPNRQIFFPNDVHYQEQPFYVEGVATRSAPIRVPYIDQTRDFVHRVLDDQARERLAHNLSVELNKVRNQTIIQRLLIIFRLASEPLAISIRDKVNSMRPTKPLPPLRNLAVEDDPNRINEQLGEDSFFEEFRARHNIPSDFGHHRLHGRMGREFLSVDILKWIEMILSIMGLVFIICAYSYHRPLGTLVLFALSILYLTICFLCAMIGKNVMSPLVQTIIELLLAILILAYTIVYIERSEILPILASVIGFLLPAVYFVSAFERSS